MALGIDAPKEFTSSTGEQKPGRLKAFGSGVMELLKLLGEAKKEELIHGHATTDRLTKKPAQEPPTEAQIEHANSMH